MISNQPFIIKQSSPNSATFEAKIEHSKAVEEWKNAQQEWKLLCLTLKIVKTQTNDKCFQTYKAQSKRSRTIAQQKIEKLNKDKLVKYYNYLNQKAIAEGHVHNTI